MFIYMYANSLDILLLGKILIENESATHNV